MSEDVPRKNGIRPNLRNEKCENCGKPAEVRYRKKYLCGECLNPEPGEDYMLRERERVNGQWGGLGADAWNKS